jgi:hypothetical protein
MKRVIFMGIALSIAMGLVAGCSDDEDDGGDDDASGGSGGSGNGNVTCDPSGDGVCENEQDCPKVVSVEARAAAQTCGLGCLEDADPGTCAVACIVDAEDMSQACAACYAGVVGCATENCLAECAENPAAEMCTQCQIDAGCREEFDTCSGLTTPMM